MIKTAGFNCLPFIKLRVLRERLKIVVRNKNFFRQPEIFSVLLLFAKIVLSIHIDDKFYF